MMELDLHQFVIEFNEIEKEYIYADLTYPRVVADRLKPTIRARLYSLMECYAYTMNELSETPGIHNMGIENYINSILLEYIQDIFIPYVKSDIADANNKFQEIRRFYEKHKVK